jgi:chromosome segregation ATPase
MDALEDLKKLASEYSERSEVRSRILQAVEVLEGEIDLQRDISKALSEEENVFIQRAKKQIADMEAQLAEAQKQLEVATGRISDCIAERMTKMEARIAELEAQAEQGPHYCRECMVNLEGQGGADGLCGMCYTQRREEARGA